MALIPPVYSKPSILLPADTAKNPAVHKIHILGDDERSRFIAHALSSVYESVEMLGWSSSSRRRRYMNIQIPGRDRQQANRLLQPVAASIVDPEDRDSSHIDHMVVTGKASTALRAIDSVKHRVDQDTTICLMNDGMGVLEEVKRSIFTGTSTPNFLMGHMSHKLEFNRKFDSVKQLKFGKVLLTTPPPTGQTVSRHDIERKVETKGNLIDQFRASRPLCASVAGWDNWLRLKLPSVLFSTVVDPVCIALDLSYKDLLRSQSANRMMHSLACEVIAVMETLPELQDCPSIHKFLDISQLQKLFHSAIVAKGDSVSNLSRQLSAGLLTDVEYLNGYFIRRAKSQGIDVKLNKMMRDMVLTKQAAGRDRMNDILPFEYTSLPASRTTNLLGARH